MPIDRAATLRHAEKLLRQGKLDAAIAEYARVVEEFPRDWNTANLLGDLYVRASQTDKAVQQFVRIADHLNEEGFFPKAAALYKKVLKLKANDEHSLMQAAEIAAGQGLLADARTYLNAIAELRVQHGDKPGAAQVRIRLGTLDPEDYDGRAMAARARLEIGDSAGALDDFKQIAADLVEYGREAQAIETLRAAAEINPQDEDIRERLLQVYVKTGDFARARECATTVDELKALSSALEAQGRADEALDLLCEAARLDPSLGELREQLARAFIARGNIEAAAEYLTADTAGDDPQLLQMLVEIDLRAGRTEQGLAVVQRLLAHDPSQREVIALLSWKMAAEAPEPAFRLAEAAADASIAASDWAAAAAALQEFVTRVPSHIVALMRLVEICVDGGLEATMYSAQAQLADAYIASGSAAEARVIAEDLVAREPWERANIERFRKALELSGEADPDAIIAERLSGQSPFMSTDLSIDFSDLPPFEETPPPAPLTAHVEPAAPSPRVPAEARTHAPKPQKGEKAPKSAEKKAPSAPGLDARSQFGLSVNAIDLGSILSELEPETRSTSRAAHEHVEVDLSVVLNDIKPPAPPTTDVDEVFAHLRDEASRKSALGEAEAHYKRGVELNASGRADEAIPELEAAARTPRFRFGAASLLGRLCRARGKTPQAVEWFERAAQAPAPTPDEGHALLYDLADALEAEGEVARALAVCLELQADAHDYRDVGARVDRLARVQTRG